MRSAAASRSCRLTAALCALAASGVIVDASVAQTLPGTGVAAPAVEPAVQTVTDTAAPAAAAVANATPAAPAAPVATATPVNSQATAPVPQASAPVAAASAPVAAAAPAAPKPDAPAAETTRSAQRAVSAVTKVAPRAAASAQASVARAPAAAAETLAQPASAVRTTERTAKGVGETLASATSIARVTETGQELLGDIATATSDVGIGGTATHLRVASNRTVALADEVLEEGVAPVETLVNVLGNDESRLSRSIAAADGVRRNRDEPIDAPSQPALRAVASAHLPSSSPPDHPLAVSPIEPRSNVSSPTAVAGRETGATVSTILFASDFTSPDGLPIANARRTRGGAADERSPTESRVARSNHGVPNAATSSSASAPGSSATGFAVLAILASLAVPGLGRRRLGSPVLAPPTSFASPLERPG
jgi:hypothetical protein